MNVRFHPAPDQPDYGERVLALLLQAALPEIQARREDREDRENSAGKEGFA